MSKNEKAQNPEDLTRLFVERANDGDAAGIAALYEPGAVMAYPPGKVTVGREAIRTLWEAVLAHAPNFEQEFPLQTFIVHALPPSFTPPRDGIGARAKGLAVSPMEPGCDYWTNQS